MQGKNTTEDDVLDTILLAKWVDALTPVVPPVGLRDKVLARIRGEAPIHGIRTIRAEEGWVEFLPGIEIKMLYRDDEAGAISCLARLQPGITLPPHVHTLAEECLVLEGEVTQGDVTIRAGDYHFAPKGAPHGSMTTTHTGALLFLRAGMGQHVPEPPRAAR